MQGSPRKLWRSFSRKWMSTSKPIMTFGKEGKKPTDTLRWLGASEEDSTLGMSGQSIMPAQVTIGEPYSKAAAKLSVIRTTTKIFQATSSKRQRGEKCGGTARIIPT
jgi:hypothetical protein